MLRGGPVALLPVVGAALLGAVVFGLPARCANSSFGEVYTARGNDSLFVKMDQTEREIFARIAKQSKEQLTNVRIAAARDVRQGGKHGLLAVISTMLSFSAY